MLKLINFFFLGGSEMAKPSYQFVICLPPENRIGPPGILHSKRQFRELLRKVATAGLCLNVETRVALKGHKSRVVGLGKGNF